MGHFPRIPPVEVQAHRRGRIPKRVDAWTCRLCTLISPRKRTYVVLGVFTADASFPAYVLWLTCRLLAFDREQSESFHPALKHHSLTSGGNFQDFMRISRPRVRRSPLRPWFVPTNSPRWRRPAAGHAQSAPRKYAGKRRTYLKTGGSTESAEELWGRGRGEGRRGARGNNHSTNQS